jgi:hypothetical protein
LIINCVVSKTNTLQVHLTQWFVSPLYQHLIVRTSDKISAFLPENSTELITNQGHLFPFQIEKEEDCGGEHREINLTTTEFSKCERIIAKSDACSYSVYGNSLNNYIDPGPDNPYGYQYLQGGNGTDSYVVGHRYGHLNVIDNYAEDGQVDHLLFQVLFHDIDITLSGMDVYFRQMIQFT